MSATQYAREAVWWAGWFGALLATLAFGVLGVGVLARVS